MLIHPGLELSSSRFVALSLRSPSSRQERIYSISPTSASGAHRQFHLPNAKSFINRFFATVYVDTKRMILDCRHFASIRANPPD
jgi:hypothetical protein